MHPRRRHPYFQGENLCTGGINKHLKHHWEQRLADGKLCQPPPPPSTASDDSDSTPPKCNQKKPAIARKKPAIQKPTGNRAKPQPKQRISLKNRPATIEAIVFTNPPLNATEKEINKAVAAWFPNTSTRMTKEGIVQCLTPGRTTPQHVQTWTDNAHAHFAHGGSKCIPQHRHQHPRRDSACITSRSSSLCRTTTGCHRSRN